MQQQVNVYRASLLDFPAPTSNPSSDFRYIQDGLLVTRNSKIVDIGSYNNLISSYKSHTISDLRGKLIIPGLIDSHLHFPQTEMLASYGEQLLEWLNNYTFPTEAKFADDDYATKIASIFLHQLVSNGTTTGMVFSTVHKSAADALFNAASKLNMCLIAGKVCMDRHCPVELQDSPALAQQHSAELIESWHGKGRLAYALTPRFAPTSSEQQLAALGELAKQYPDVYIQTHLSENLNEIEWVRQLFPKHRSYLDVYDQYGLVRKGSVFGHCLHLQDEEWRRLKSAQATIAFCPSSNLFLGSGLFELEKARQHGINVSLASDVGAGTSFNMLRTMGDAYKVCQLKHNPLCPLEGLYMMTQGAACNLGLEHTIGNLNTGTDADFVVLDPAFNELSALRTQHLIEERTISAPQDVLFALSMLADERTIFQTYIAGNCVHQVNKELN
ncbi:guanine deaminase [Aliiglaciecola litoralis]